MAKTNKEKKEAAEEAIRLIEKEAEIRAKMNASYDDYIEAVKTAHALQKTLNQNLKIQADVQAKVNDLKSKLAGLTGAAYDKAKEELDIEEEKLKILDKQNQSLKKQVDLYKSAAKEANVLSMTAGKAFAGIGKAITNLPGMVTKAWSEIKSLGLFEFDKAIKESALSMGVLSKESVGFRDNLKNAAKQTSMMGVNLKALAELQSSYSQNLGRTVVLSQKSLEGMAAMSKMTGLGAEGTAQMAADMDLQGYSAERTADFVDETLKASHKMGVNATKVMKNLSGNLKLMNKYHFKEGAKGLAKMAQLVTKLGIEMEDVSAMADKLWNIEGAVEMSAQLNVMGGAWAQMADPFHLMYMARNDMQGLTEEIARASQESISFNDATGEFDMTAEGMHRLKIIAEQTGVSYEKLVTMGKNMAKFDKIKTQVGFSIGGSEEDKAMMDYISSKSILDKSGKAEIMINGKPKLLSQLNAADKAVIQGQMNEQESMKKRAEEARTFDEQLSYLIDQLKVYMLPFIETLNKNLMPKLDKLAEKFTTEGWGDMIEKFAVSIGEFVSSIGSFMIENPKLTAGLLGLAKGIPLMVGAFKLLGGLWDMAKWFANGVALAKGFNSFANVGGSGGSGGDDGSGSGNGKRKGFSVSRTLKALKGGYKQGGVGGAIKAGGKSIFRQGKSVVKGAGGMFKGLAKGAGKGLLKGLGKGLLKGVPLVGSLMSLGEMGMDMFENGFSWKKLGKGLGNAALNMIPGVGLVNSGMEIASALGYGKGSLLDNAMDWFGGDSDTADDALFNAPVKDGFFGGGNMMKSLAGAMIPGAGAAMAIKDLLSTRGIIQNGKITPIDTRDDVLALKKGGAIDNHANSVSGGGTINHTFQPLVITGKIIVEGPGGQEINKNLLENESVRRQISKIVEEETRKRVSMGKMKG